MRTVVVTGSASGVGASVRRRLEGDRIHVIGIDRAGAEIVADLSAPPGRSEAMNQVIERARGSIDGLVVCASVDPIDAAPAEIVAVDYFGAVHVLDGLRPALAAGSAPAAVAVASNALAVVPTQDLALVDAMLGGDEATALRLAAGFDTPTVHAMSKYALARAVRHRASGWGKARIRLNALAPGPLATHALAPDLDPELDEPVPLVDSLPVPLDRRVEPTEVAAAVDFLLGPDASFVHGAVLFVDGGTDALVRPDWV